jgi:hypothetical protein
MSYAHDWRIYIDWTDTVTYVDMTPYVIDAQWSLGMGRPYQMTADESILTLTMSNADGRFAPEKTSGPYYGNMLPRRRVRVDHDGNVMFFGFIDSYSVDPTGNFTKRAVITARGVKHLYDDKPADVPRLVDVTSDVAIEAVVRSVAVPPATLDYWVLGVPGYSELGSTTELASTAESYELETGLFTFDEVGHTFTGSAYDAIADIAASERGKFWFDREGRGRYWNRQHLQYPQTPVTTYENIVGGQYVTGVSLQGGGSGVNVVEMTCFPRAYEERATLWRLDEPLVLAPQEVKMLKVRYTAEAGTQVAGYNVFVNQPENVIASVNANAKKAEIRLENFTDDEQTVPELTVTGTKITTYNAQTVTETDAAAVAQFSQRVFTDTMPLVNDEEEARQAAAFELSVRGPFAARFERVRMIARSDTDLQLAAREIGDVVRVVDEGLSHDTDYVILGERHTLKHGLKNHEVEWVVEPVNRYTAWLLGEAGYSELGTTTKVGF